MPAKPRGRKEFEELYPEAFEGKKEKERSAERERLKEIKERIKNFPVNPSSRKISPEYRRRAKKSLLYPASGKGIKPTATEQAEMHRILNESGIATSDDVREARASALGKYIKRNDGGIAKKTRTF